MIYNYYGKPFDINVTVLEKNKKFSASINIDGAYYETSPYDRRYCAISEAKGFLEGVKAQIDGVLDYIEKELNKEEQQ